MREVVLANTRTKEEIRKIENDYVLALIVGAALTKLRNQSASLFPKASGQIGANQARFSVHGNRRMLAALLVLGPSSWPHRGIQYT